MKKTFFAILTCALLLASCENDPFTEKPVSEFNVQQNSIRNHTRIRMVAWSGGPINDGEGRHPGYQYVVENAETGKRFRILSNEPFDELSFTGNLQYISYTSNDTIDFLLFQTLQHTEKGGDEMEKHLRSVTNIKNVSRPKIPLPETIWSNAEFREIEQKNYPTVFGIIVQVEETTGE